MKLDEPTLKRLRDVAEAFREPWPNEITAKGMGKLVEDFTEEFDAATVLQLLDAVEAGKAIVEYTIVNEILCEDPHCEAGECGAVQAFNHAINGTKPEPKGE